MLILSVAAFVASSTPSQDGGIDTSVIVAIIAAVASVAGIVFANRYTSRTARDAAAKSVLVEQGKLDESRRQSLMDNMQEEITRLNDMRKQDRQEFEARLSETNTRLTTISEEHERYRRERSYLQQQVDSLVLWSRAVVRVMRGNNLSYPPPPPGVDTDPEGFAPIRPTH